MNCEQRPRVPFWAGMQASTVPSAPARAPAASPSARVLECGAVISARGDLRDHAAGEDTYVWMGPAAPIWGV